jgi:hypothetical protein
MMMFIYYYTFAQVCNVLQSWEGNVFRRVGYAPETAENVARFQEKYQGPYFRSYRRHLATK